jgi:hypothetical protein
MKNISVSNIFKKDSLATLAYIFVPGLIFLGTAVFIAKSNGIFFETISRDPLQILNGKPYVGIISNIGILFWCSTCAVLLYSCLISRIKKGPENITNFLFFSALLSVLMLVDDLFLMHDVVFPDFLKIDERVFYLFYGLSVIAIFIRYYKIVMNTDYILLILSFLFLGLSAATDEVRAMGFRMEHPYIIEDSFKFLGILAWFSYFSRTGFKYVRIAIA